MPQQQDSGDSPTPPSPSQDDEQAELFSAVLLALDRKQLPIHASSVLRCIQPKHPDAGSELQPLVGDAIYGSYHVIFPLTFSDGLRWAVKIPINGTLDNWDELSTAALTCEARTMQMLKKKTTIPLPEVFDFSATTENVLGCPYIIMSFISGLPLYDVWFGHRLQGVGPDTMIARRTRALDGIASAMAQLGRFTFSTSGSLVFGDDGEVLSLGPLRKVDNKAMLDRWHIHHDPDDAPNYAELPASDDPQAYYTFMLDQHQENIPTSKGVSLLLRQLISWIPQLPGMTPFVLVHPDFDIQNFIMSEEGNLLGIIDWDGVAAVPRTLGNEGYPGWLTRDWDPAMYGWTPSMDQGSEPEGVWEDSPDDLALYRGAYANMMASKIKVMGLNSKAELCRISLISENLAIAANDPPCRNEILKKVVGEMWKIVRPGERLDFFELVGKFAEGNVEDSLLETLSDGFKALLSKEGL